MRRGEGGGRVVEDREGLELLVMGLIAASFLLSLSLPPNEEQNQRQNSNAISATPYFGL